MQSIVARGTSQGNRCKLPTGSVRTKAVSAPPTNAPSTPALINGLHDVTKNDVGKRATQEELNNFLKCYVSSQIERVKYIDPKNIIGEIPKDLRGTLFRNGPGNFEYGRDEPGSVLGRDDQSKTNGHPFEGDGLLWTFVFEDDGQVFMRKKFARTKCLQDEMKAGKLLYKGAFAIGSLDDKFVWPFDFSTIRKPSNTGVIHWGGNVLALNEGDLPFLMDTELNSLGTSTLDLWSEKQMQCAHYRITTEADGSKRLCTFGFQSAPTDFPARILELDESNNTVASTDYTIKDAAFGFFHDFMVTDNYYVMIENPMRMDYWKLLTQYGTGRESVTGCLYHDTDRPQKVHLIPRPGKAKDSEEARVFEATTKFTFHQIHAWENSKGAVVLDVLGKDYNTFKIDLDNLPVTNFELPELQTTVRRIVCQGNTGKAAEYDLRHSDALRWRDVELPAIPPPQYTCKPHNAIIGMANRDTQVGATGIHQSVIKIKLPHQLGVTQPWDPSRISIEEYYPGVCIIKKATVSTHAGDGRYCLEPFFVPKANAEVGDTFEGNDGYILVHVQDLRVKGEETTWLEILDAEDLAAGPVAAIDLQELIPPGLHGHWSDTQLGPTDNELNLPAEGWVNNIRYNL